jgi:hypothetical protein
MIKAFKLFPQLYFNVELTLTWYDAQGNRHLRPEEQERLAKEQEQQERERLEIFLRSKGFDPEHLPE